MADITGIFKSTVKMLKVRHKELSSMKLSPNESEGGDNQARIENHLTSNNSKRKSQHLTPGSSSDLFSASKSDQFSHRTRAIVSQNTYDYYYERNYNQLKILCCQ